MTVLKARRFRRRKSKLAISEVISTIVLVAVTVVIGSVAWVWANSSAISSENSYFNVTAEKFEIVASSFSGTSAPWGGITLYVFNSGAKATTTAAILITYGSCSLSATGAAAIGVALPAGKLTPVGPISFTPTCSA